MKKGKELLLQEYCNWELSVCTNNMGRAYPIRRVYFFVWHWINYKNINASLITSLPFVSAYIYITLSRCWPIQNLQLHSILNENRHEHDMLFTVVQWNAVSLTKAQTTELSSVKNIHYHFLHFDHSTRRKQMRHDNNHQISQRNYYKLLH